jgi:hypothetical protein
MRTVKLEDLNVVETVSSTDEVLALRDNNLVRAPAEQFIQGALSENCTSCVQTFTTQDLPNAPQVGTLAFDTTRDRLVYYKTSGWHFVGDDSPCDGHSTSSPSSSESLSSISSSSISSSDNSSISSMSVSSPSSSDSLSYDSISSSSISSSDNSSISSMSVSSPSSSDSFSYVPGPLVTPITAESRAGTFAYRDQTAFQSYLEGVPSTEMPAYTYRSWNVPFYKFKNGVIIHLKIGSTDYYTEGFVYYGGGDIQHGLVSSSGSPIPIPPSGIPSGTIVEIQGTVYDSQ